MDLKEAYEKAKVIKSDNGQVGHCSYSKKVIMRLKKELSEEQFGELTGGQVYYIVMEMMKEEHPDMYKWVIKNRGKKFRMQVGAHLSMIRNK